MNPPASGGREAAPFSSFEEYRAQVTALARAIATAEVLLATVDLERLEHTVERADLLGPVIDPTAWRAARGQLEAQRVLIAWARESRRRFQDLLVLVPALMGVERRPV